MMNERPTTTTDRDATGFESNAVTKQRPADTAAPRDGGVSDSEQILPSLLRRVGLRLQWKLRVEQIVVFAAVLAAWELIVLGGLVEEFWISRPSLVGTRLWSLVGEGEVWPHVGATLQATFTGFGLGLVTGVLAGLLLGLFRSLSDIVDPLVMGLYALPRVALAPLFVLYFGIGVASKVALVVSLVFFIMLLNTRAGVRSVDVDLIHAVRTMGASRKFLLRKVILPGTVPWILSGARISIVFALMGAVVGEMLIARRGLGRLVAVASNLFDTAGIFSILVIMAFIAVVLNWILSTVERRMEKYSASHR